MFNGLQIRTGSKRYRVIKVQRQLRLPRPPSPPPSRSCPCFRSAPVFRLLSLVNYFQTSPIARYAVVLPLQLIQYVRFKTQSFRLQLRLVQPRSLDDGHHLYRHIEGGDVGRRGVQRLTLPMTITKYLGFNFVVTVIIYMQSSKHP